MKPLRIRPEAANDAREAALWYENERPGLGREFLGVVRDVLGRIETMPLRFPIVLEEIRRALLPRFPFGVFFVVDDDRSTVLAIMHLRRTPTSWDRRQQPLHREKNLFPRVVDFGNLYRALRGASHGKREQPEVREFEYHDRPRTDARLAVQPPVIAVDTNLLAYAHRRGVAEHRVAQRVIERASRDVRGWGISSEGLPTQAPPGGGMLVWTPGVGFDERLLQLATDLNVTGPRIFHLQIGLTAFEHGAAELWTHDRNFVKIPGLRLIHPLSVSNRVPSCTRGTWSLDGALPRHARTLSTADIAGVRVLLVHAADDRARAFYEHFGFEPSPTDPLHVLLVLADARRAGF